MTLSTKGKDYIAQHFGKSNCFASSGISYTDPAGEAAIGSTSDIVATLKLDDGGLSRGPDEEIYDNIVTANGGAVTGTDISWITQNDGKPAEEAQYCYLVVSPTSTPTPLPKVDVSFTCSRSGCYLHEENMGIHELLPSTVSLDRDVDYQFEVQQPEWIYIMMPTIRVDVNGNISCLNVDGDRAYCNRSTPPGVVVNSASRTVDFYPPLPQTPTLTPVPPAGTFIFVGVPTGIPSVFLDLTGLIMRQNTIDYHFEMSGIKITNTSSNAVYLAMEVKLFSGVKTTCPASGQVFDGMDRYVRAKDLVKVVRIKVLDPGAVATYSSDFYQPITIVGVHTVCLLIHGAWTQADIDAEITPITG